MARPRGDKPIYRDKLQYDWHWDWNTGSGEMGNWGVHVLDDLRSNVFLDKVTLPERIFGGEGTGRLERRRRGAERPLRLLRHRLDPGRHRPQQPPGGSDVEEIGPPGTRQRLHRLLRRAGSKVSGSSAVAFDKDGKVIKKFRGNGGNGVHHQNFLDAVRVGDPSLLNASVAVGHDSTGWCNLANIAFRAGRPFTADAAKGFDDPEGIWASLLKETEEHLAAYSIPIAGKPIVLSPTLTVDPEKGSLRGRKRGDRQRVPQAQIPGSVRRAGDREGLILGLHD